MMSELFRKMHHVSPMAAKILSVLVIEGCAEGLTFEYLIERVQASKSTLSTNINFLLDKGLIYYDTKERESEENTSNPFLLTSDFRNFSN